MEQQVARIGKEFKNVLQQESCRREREMLYIIKGMISNTSIKKTKKLLSMMDALINAMPSQEATNHDIINYNDWLIFKKKRI